MKKTYQHGYLRRTRRKAGPDRWEFLWRETDETGARLRRTAIIGTVEQYPTETSALVAANGLRMRINADLYRRHLKPLSVGTPIAELLGIFPRLDEATIELASVYAKAVPEKGRPKRRDLPKGTLVSVSKGRLQEA